MKIIMKTHLNSTLLLIDRISSKETWSFLLIVMLYIINILLQKSLRFFLPLNDASKLWEKPQIKLHLKPPPKVPSKSVKQPFYRCRIGDKHEVDKKVCYRPCTYLWSKALKIPKDCEYYYWLFFYYLSQRKWW